MNPPRSDFQNPSTSRRTTPPGGHKRTQNHICTTAGLTCLRCDQRSKPPLAKKSMEACLMLDEEHLDDPPDLCRTIL